LITALNGTPINVNNAKEASFELINLTNLLESNLSVVSGYTAKHYVWVMHCDEDECWETCDYSWTENVTDSLNISDSIEVQLYNFTYNATHFVDQNLSGLLDYWLTYNVSNDFAEVLFESRNSFIRTKGVDYQLRYSHEPYNVLSYEAVRKNNATTVYGASILYENRTENASNTSQMIHALIPYSKDCTMSFKSHFNNSILHNFCNLTNGTPILSINLTNQTNDTITLEILFFDNSTNSSIPDKEIVISYLGLEMRKITDENGKIKIQFPYSESNKNVKASFMTDFQTKSAEAIFIVPGNLPDLNDQIFYTIVFLLILFLLIKLVKRWFSHAFV
jgi:hypothetical protein